MPRRDAKLGPSCALPVARQQRPAILPGEYGVAGNRPSLLRSAGTAGSPVFGPPVPIKLGDRYLAFGLHIAAVWPTDMNGDGRDDLIIDAEDGRVYRFLRDELTQ